MFHTIEVKENFTLNTCHTMHVPKYTNNFQKLITGGACQNGCLLIDLIGCKGPKYYK